MDPSQRYRKLTILQHLLQRPETYVGAMELAPVNMHLVDLGLTEVTISRAILKVLQEITSNAYDNISRGGTTRIDVEIFPEGFSVKNNGAPIPIVLHEEHGVTIPELVFGHFLTGDNYDDEETRERGGRNGYGAKITNAFSKHFEVEVVDDNVKKKIRLHFKDNMGSMTKKITSCSNKSYTKVTAHIDFERFGLQQATPLIVKAWERTVYDLAATTPSNVSIYLNKAKLKVKGYKDYCKMWGECLYFNIGDNVQLAVYKEMPDVRPPSFVNGVECNKGTHIQQWAGPLTKKLSEIVSGALKTKVSPAKMAKHVCICGNFTIPNPKFASQTKDVCTTNKREFVGWEWPKSALQKCAKMLQDAALLSAEGEVRKTLKQKVTRRVNIPKLDDARYAGHPQKWKDCSLILTEGDSAKGFAVSGFNVVGRHFWGAFPLRGKFINVKSSALVKTMKNAEVKAIQKILGLELDKPPTSLRYGRVVIMADQDDDGSHIIALLLNFFSHYKAWRPLLENGFLQIFRTPLIKAKSGRLVKKFYDMESYNQWKTTEDVSSWKVKYYKGLGTSTAAEAQEAFRDLSKHLVPIIPGPDGDKYMELAFSKSTDERKKFLKSELVPNASPSNFAEFSHGRLLEFYNANNYRTLPHVMDGLKPTMRKILYALLTSKTNDDRKVAALAAYVTEKMEYHHGEASLANTIIGMAQTFTGANNINYLVPEGSFGTRSMGGKDAASPRYIYTRLADITKKLFPAVDFEILQQQEVEGRQVEPVFLAPVLPMLIIQGGLGIGVGWSCDFPPHDPVEVCDVVRRWIRSEDKENFDFTLPAPKWKGFTGTVERNGKKLITYGNLEAVKKNEFLVTELPVRVWTNDFREWISAQPFVKRVIEESTLEDVRVRIITEEPIEVERMRQLCMEGSKKPRGDDKKKERKIKDSTLKSTMNVLLHCYDSGGKLKAYASEEEILKEWCEQRAKMYVLRKVLLLSKIEADIYTVQRKLYYVKTIESLGSCLGQEDNIRRRMVEKGYGPNIDDLLNIPIGRIMKGTRPIQTKLDGLTASLRDLRSKSHWVLWLDDLEKTGFVRKRARED